jgi:starch phosphorylase
VQRSKASMQSILPRFNAQRMVVEYVRDFYAPAQAYHRRLEEGGSRRPAVRLAAWKRRVMAGWPAVRARRTSDHVREVRPDQRIPIEIAAHLGKLDIRDVRAECLFGRVGEDGEFVVHETFVLQPLGLNGSGEALFRLDIAPPLSGLQFYKLRLYPYDPLLRHPLESGLTLWI